LERSNLLQSGLQREQSSIPPCGLDMPVNEVEFPRCGISLHLQIPFVIGERLQVRNQLAVFLRGKMRDGFLDFDNCAHSH